MSVKEAVRGAELDPPADVHGTRGLPPAPRRGAALSARPDNAREQRDEPEKTINVDVNGEVYEREVQARRLLVHFIRDDLELTGTHVGCDTGNCGACTVLSTATRSRAA